LLITSPSSPAFETTVEKLISWQVPPPRQGPKVQTAVRSSQSKLL
jgi:hypothetical protein